MPLKDTRTITRLVALILLYVGLWLFMANTDPHNLSLPLLILPFIAIFIGIYWPLSLLLELFLKGLKGSALDDKATKRLRMAALLGAGTPTFLLILSSINQLTFKDILLSFMLAAGLIFYINRSRLA